MIYLLGGILIAGLIAILIIYIVTRPEKNDLREKCIEAYGQDFAEIYDNLNSGIPVGDFLETSIVLAMIEAVKKGEPIKMKHEE